MPGTASRRQLLRHTTPHPACPRPTPDYDLKVLQRQAEAAQLPLLRHARFLDTYRLAQGLKLRGPNNRGGLGDLHELYTGAPHDGAHRALADCRANDAVLRGMLGHMFGGSSLQGEAGAAWGCAWGCVLVPASVHLQPI